MINPMLYWFLLLPVLLAAAVWVVKRDTEGSWLVAGLYALVAVIVISASFAIAKGAATGDTEIWNGQITSKARVHGTYVESYDCHCHDVTTGSGQNKSTHRECDTCYRDHFTVKWGCASTIGDYMIDNEDSLSRSVYLLPDPERWTRIMVGDPVSKQHRYTNYVQAVPDSLFRPTSTEMHKRFAALIPAYPDKIYDLYENDHFASPGFGVPDAGLWNRDIANMLRELGPKKQVNAIVVIAKTDDPNYEFALRDAWNGAKKNDVVLLIGSKTWPTIDFVRVLTWSKNEQFKVELRDAISDIGTVDRDKIMQTLQSHIASQFERRHMADFKYLESEIDPPTWMLWMDVILTLLGALGAWYFLDQQNPRARYTNSMGIR